MRLNFLLGRFFCNPPLPYPISLGGDLVLPGYIFQCQKQCQVRGEDFFIAMQKQDKKLQRESFFQIRICFGANIRAPRLGSEIGGTAL